jgi:hypothetical protein
MIQITPQMRVLVAVEAVDFRKGIDSLAQLCRNKLTADPFSGCVFVFRSRRATAIKVLVYDGTGFWLATKRAVQGKIPLVAGRRDRTRDAGAPGAVVVRGGQPGDGSCSGVAKSKLKELHKKSLRSA